MVNRPLLYQHAHFVECWKMCAPCGFVKQAQREQLLQDRVQFHMQISASRTKAPLHHVSLNPNHLCVLQSPALHSAAPPTAASIYAFTIFAFYFLFSCHVFYEFIFLFSWKIPEQDWIIPTPFYSRLLFYRLLDAVLNSYAQTRRRVSGSCSV